MSIELIAILLLGGFLTYVIAKESKKQRMYNIEEQITNLLFAYSKKAKTSLEKDKSILISFNGLIAEVKLSEKFEEPVLKDDETVLRISLDYRK
jgi:hypothetical protein